MSSILLFFIGYTLAPTAYYKKIGWLTAYSFFIVKLIDKHFNKNWHPVKIFLVLFSLNSISLFINLLSGYAIVLPYFAAIYMGLNIGIIIYHTLEGRFYYLSLINPISIFELPAAWLSLSIAIQFSLSKYFHITNIANISFTQYCFYYLMTIIPLLIMSGIIETLLIVLTRKHENKAE